MNRHVCSRAGFVGGVAILLAVVLALLLAWKSYFQISHIPANMLGADRARTKVLTSNVTVGLTLLALSGGVGAAAYFMGRKSERAAAIGMNAVLGLGVAALSFQAFRTLTQAPPKPSQPGQVAAQPAPIAPAPMPRSQPTPAQPVPAQPALPSPSTTPAPAAKMPPVRATPAPTPPAPNAAIAPIVARRRDEVHAECAKLAQAAGEAMDFASKPKKSGTELDAKITKMQELIDAAGALEKRLRAESNELQSELAAAGVDTAEAMRASADFSREESVFERSNAAAAVGRFATDALEFCRVMRENLPRIQISPAGEVTSKDREVESKLFHVRAQVKFQLSDRERTLGALR